MNLPPVSKNLHETEVLAKPSDDVLIKCKRATNIIIGKYYHGLDEWQLSGWTGFHKNSDIEEWWPMPEIGTGEKVGGVKNERV